MTGGCHLLRSSKESDTESEARKKMVCFKNVLCKWGICMDGYNIEGHTALK
jgi:hypothetical protein